MTSVCCLPLLLALGCVLEAAGDWRVQYSFDRDGASLELRDLRFASARRGAAVGIIHQQGKRQPVLLTTTDGGARWDLARFPEPGVSLFFLDDSLGWLVTENGVWRTRESVREWKKLAGLKGLHRVWFLDEKHGFASGYPKAVYETWDGGSIWTAVGAAARPHTTREHTVYDWIDFPTPRFGLIAGFSRPQLPGEAGRVPGWMEPRKDPERREVPAMAVLLETHDGGRSWNPSESSLFGVITRFRLAPDGRGLGLIRFFGAFDYPSEVIRLDWTTGKSTRAFRRRDRDISDLAIAPGGRAYLAGIECSGASCEAAIPGKLTVLVSDDYEEWREMEVDHRATARRVMLAVAGKDEVWAATDTGLLLKMAAR